MINYDFVHVPESKEDLAKTITAFHDLMVIFKYMFPNVGKTPVFLLLDELVYHLMNTCDEMDKA